MLKRRAKGINLFVPCREMCIAFGHKRANSIMLRSNQLLKRIQLFKHHVAHFFQRLSAGERGFNLRDTFGHADIEIIHCRGDMLANLLICDPKRCHQLVRLSDQVGCFGLIIGQGRSDRAGTFAKCRDGECQLRCLIGGIAVNF